ncbi:MAG: sulfatase [Planctomycetaceae bacterium]|nr:sulfatase [Planctomycetaceae bacterium]
MQNRQSLRQSVLWNFFPPLFRAVGHSTLLFLLAGVVLTLAESVSFAEEKPNFLIAFADDWGQYASAYAKLSPGGVSDVVSTPHFDRVAKEGVLFPNAFVNAPSCTPCRSSFLSGQYFWRTGRGAILQGAIWDESIPTFPLILQKNGYHIGHTYKVWSPGSPANAPYGAQATAYNKRGTKFNGFSQYVSRAKDHEAAKQELYDEVRGNFEDFLKNREEGEPFCYWFGPTNVHRKWIAGSGKTLWGIDPDSLKGKLPPFLPDVPVVREDFADYLGEVRAFDAGLGVLLKELEDRGELENTVVIVSGDHGAPGFPGGKCNLYDFGVQVPLAIRWPKGIPGDRVVEDFVCLPDLCPTILEMSGETPPAVMTGLSLKPVLESTEQGIVDPHRDAVFVGRERHVAAVRAGNLPYPQRAIRTRDFLYIRNFKPERWPMGEGPGYGRDKAEWPGFDQLANDTFLAFGDMDASPTKAWLIGHQDDEGMQEHFNYAFGRRPAEELYDLGDDPHQMNNVADNPSYAGIRQKLRVRLMRTLLETGDPRVTGGGDTYDLPPFTDDFRRPNRKGNGR